MRKLKLERLRGKELEIVSYERVGVTRIGTDEGEELWELLAG